MILNDKAVKISTAKSTGDLIEMISTTLKNEGKTEVQYDLEKACEFKSSMKLETKANEIVHTTNTGYGAELVPGVVQSTNFLDLVPQYSPILQVFRGYHGRNMDKIMEVPVIGRSPKHILGSEATTGAFSTFISQGTGKFPTAKVTITQKKYFLAIDVSDEEVRFVTVLDILQKIQEKLAKSGAETQNASIINADSEAGINANINKIDGTPGGTEYYMGGQGLRYAGINGTGTKKDIGTIEFADYLDLYGILGDRGANPADNVWILNRAFYTKSMGLSEFKDASINGRLSTVFSGSITNILGSDVFLNADLTKANNVGKISVTPGNNSLGQALYVNRDAVQYGYNGDYSLELYRVPGYGWQVFGYYYMGFSTANQIAGETADATVAYGYNATV